MATVILFLIRGHISADLIYKTIDKKQEYLKNKLLERLKFMSQTLHTLRATDKK